MTPDTTLDMDVPTPIDSHALDIDGATVFTRWSQASDRVRVIAAYAVASEGWFKTAFALLKDHQRDLERSDHPGRHQWLPVVGRMLAYVGDIVDAQYGPPQASSLRGGMDVVDRQGRTLANVWRRARRPAPRARERRRRSHARRRRRWRLEPITVDSGRDPAPPVRVFFAERTTDHD